MLLTIIHLQPLTYSNVSLGGVYSLHSLNPFWTSLQRNIILQLTSYMHAYNALNIFHSDQKYTPVHTTADNYWQIYTTERMKLNYYEHH